MKTSLITPTLKLLAYCTLGGTALIEATSSGGATAATQITMWTALGAATLKTAGTLAGEVSGGLFHDLLFGNKKSLTHSTIIEVAGEAIGRALTVISADLLNSHPDHPGLETLEVFLKKQNVHQLQHRWLNLVRQQVSPQLAILSNAQVESHLNDGALLRADELAQLVATLTTDSKGNESYLDDETLQLVGFLLLQTLPAAFVDVLTDEHSGKVYRQRLHEMLNDLSLKVNRILAGVETLLSREPLAATESAEFVVSKPPSIARLPNMLTPDLFGRDKVVQMLNDAWDNPHPNQPKTNVIVFVAFGGSGKSALVHHWVHEVMARENYRGAERVYAWSFWSQGSDQPQTSADPFIDAALRWFGDPDPTAGSPWDKGERLAHLIKQTRTLLILDGLEPLQHPKHTMEGRLKEQSMQALLKELAAGQPGLCVVSTREHVADLQGFRPPAVIAHDLEQLSPAAGASILRQQQIKGSDAELQQASAEFGNHALALTILASFLHNAYDGDIRKRNEIGPLTEDLANGGHARRVMTSYETWLRDAGEDTLLAMLRVLGLFNRPADAASLAALRAAPAIPDLTEALLPMSEPQWKQMLAKLRRLKLLTDSSTNDEVDAHPLLREHFRDQLQRGHPAAWQAGNLRLYEHLTRAAKDLPDTLEEMQPLYAALAHGCAAGLFRQALEEVFYRRIRRKERAFSWKELGLVAADLSALSNFFDVLWDTPSSNWHPQTQGSLLNEAGFLLHCLGRTKDAISPLQQSVDLAASFGNWEGAARASGNLYELYKTIGYLEKALTTAQAGVFFAEKSQKRFSTILAYTVLGDAFHQIGQISEAKFYMRRAEKLQKQDQPKKPYLYSFQGARYRELLLTLRKFYEASHNATLSLTISKQTNVQLDIALEYLSLGKVEYLKEGNNNLERALSYLNEAVNMLKKSGIVDHIPTGYLARATFFRQKKEFTHSKADLMEALQIAERGEMRLHLTDYHLESAHLALAEGDKDIARDHSDKARQLIAETGYHRRDGELKEIEEQLG